MQGQLEEKAGEWHGRGTPRRKLFLAASVAQTTAACIVDVFNISETGMLLGTGGKLDLDEPITVVLPEAGERSARIVWFAENLYGCRFEEPLDEATLNACLSHSSPEGPQQPAAAPGETFGERLKRLRSQSRYSMVELAERVGVTKPTLWKWETGKVMPRQAALEKLAAELELSAVELLYGRTEVRHGASPIMRDRTSVAATGEKLADVIARSRNEIARCAGTPASKVNIDIDWA